MIIFGFRGYARTLAMLTLVCGRCGNPAAHRIVEHTRKLTLFFIPVFPVSKSRTMTCTFCGLTTRLNADESERLIAGAVGDSGASAPLQAPGPRLEK